MEIQKTNFNGLVILNPTVYSDDRGLFFETYRDYLLNNALGFEVKFLQENQSVSKKNVFRGFHFQTGEFAQAKLVRVVSGSVLDVVIDIRESESTFGKTHMELLTDANRKQMFIPKGFAHGFLTLSDEAIFQYKCDQYYNKDFENGINPLDENLEFTTIMNKHDFIINERDRNFMSFQEYKDLDVKF